MVNLYMYQPLTRMLAVIACAALGAGQKEVVTLTPQNFADAVVPDELWLLKFYAPWCGHCKRLAPVLDKVAEETEDDVHFGKVDCTAAEGLCKQWDVSGYPTVIMTQGGTKWVHKGPRSADSIKRLISRMRGPAVHEVSTTATLADMHSGGKQVIFFQGRAGGPEAADAHAAFDSIARRMQHSDNFAAAAAPDVLRAVLKGQEPPPTPFIARLEDGEAPQVLPPSPSPDAEAIEAFVAAKRNPTFSLSTPNPSPSPISRSVHPARTPLS